MFSSRWQPVVLVSTVWTILGLGDSNGSDSRFPGTVSGRKSDLRLEVIEREGDRTVPETQAERLGVELRSHGSTKDVPKSTRLLAARSAGPPARPARSNWPRFRGPGGSGVSTASGLPTEWSDSKNIVWKVELPGPGASSPIVWGDHVYVTSYSGYGLKEGDPHANIPNLVRHLVCVDRRSGKVRWQANHPTGEISEHGLSNFISLHGYASSTPVADESGVYVYFGRGGILAFDHTGQKRWHAPVGGREHTWGSASSPVLFEELLIVHADPEIQTLVALDQKTGQVVWKVPTGQGDSWSTPLIVNVDGQHELVFHHSVGDPTASVVAVNPLNGQELWKSNVLKNYLCPSPFAHDGIIYWTGYQRSAAIRAGGRGDVTASHVLWQSSRGTEVVTPIVHRGHLYWTQEEGGIAYCASAETGKLVYQHRLKPAVGRLYASPVTGDGKLYYVTREHGTYVLAAHPEFEILAHNRLESDKSVFNGSPAISHKQILLRSNKSLYCIGE